MLNFSSSNNPQLYAIDFAVSFLSPVKTHNFIPASEKSFKVSFTLSCNSSSIAVTPNKIKSFSTTLANSSIFSFLL